jgi:hypothetical protein
MLDAIRYRAIYPRLQHADGPALFFARLRIGAKYTMPAKLLSSGYPGRLSEKRR